METDEIFAQMAQRYDAEERVHNAGIIAQQMRLALSDTQNKTALDYGCGTGLIGLALASLFGQMLLVDSSPQMIAVVENKIADAGLANTRTLCANFCEHTPQGVSADYILVSQVLLHVPNYSLLLQQFFALLNPGGHLLVVDFDKNENIVSDKVHNGFNQSQLQQLCLQVGFASASSQTFYHGKNMFMRQDASLFILHATK
ncbi:class I SAM-dependent methyltransferase [Ruminococcaceae bacterium OttesenSCG-928-A16]|nr:class I SAM-dependent methyltransferase [Ruminococcaceae bacterium OttesenSCG-928-A16]